MSVSKEILAAYVSDAVLKLRSSHWVLPDGLSFMPGYTSVRQRKTLNRLCSFKECKYAEIGVFHGASLFAAGYLNGGSYTGIDNFVEGTKDEFILNYHKYGSTANFRFIDSSSQLLEPETLRGTNVFFYDANFTEFASDSAFKKFVPVFADSFVLIVDNWSRPLVRRLLLSTLNELEYSVYCGYQLMSDHDLDILEWSNGWFMAVIEKKPIRETTELTPIPKDAVPLWDIKQRLEKGLLTVKDYEKR